MNDCGSVHTNWLANQLAEIRFNLGNLSLHHSGFDVTISKKEDFAKSESIIALIIISVGFFLQMIGNVIS